jgi:hypothetical protein
MRLPKWQETDGTIAAGLERPAKRYTKLGFGGEQIESNQRLM